MKRIGIFGGSFNPVHQGHTSLVRELLSKGCVDKVLVVPVFTPPHKSSKELASAEHRINMLSLAFKSEIEEKLAEISEIETNNKTPSYSFQTVKKLKEIYPNNELFFIMGSDMLLTFRQWKNWEEILKNVSLLAVSRENGDRNLLENEKKHLQSLGGRVIICDIDIKEISSTEIRDKIKNNLPTDGILKEEVRNYIEKNNLYVR